MKVGLSIQLNYRATLNPILHGLFIGRGHESPHHNFVVIALIITKFGTGIMPDVFHTKVTNKIVTSLVLRNYDV